MALRSVQVVLSAATGAYTTAMGNAAQTTDKVGKSLIGIGLAAGAASLVAVKKFADFDQQMSAVDAATHATTDSMNQLRDAAMEAGARTSFSAVEAAQGIEELAKAGVSTADILAGGLNGALDLAAAGSLGVGEAAEIAATALTQFKLEGREIPHVADLLAAGAGKAQGSVQDMGMALKQSGLVAAQYGLSIEETTAGLASFASAGLVGSDAGTSFKSMLQRLTPVSAEASSLMTELGFSAFDAQGNFIGLEAVADEMQTSFAGMTDEQRNATMATLFGSDAVRAAAVLYDQGASGIENWTDKVNDQGYAAETSRRRLNNLSGDLEALSGSFETAMIKTGSAGDSAARSTVQWATGVVNAYGEWEQSSQSLVLTTGVLTAGVGLAGGAMLLLIPRIAATRAAMSALGLTTGATGVALTALSAAAGVGIMAYLGNQFLKARGAALVAKLEVESLSASLVDLSESGKLSAASFDFFDTSRAPLTGWIDDVESSAEALDNFAASAQKGLSEGFWASVKNGMSMSVTEIGAFDEQVRQIDASLAELVGGGRAEAAEDALTSFLDEMSSRGVNVDELRGRLVQYDAALSGSAESMDKAESAGAFYTQSLADQETQVQETAEALDALIQSMVDAGMIILSTRAATREWEAALDDVTGVLEENGQTLDVTTEAGRANQAMLDEVASSALDLANAIYEETGSEEAFRSSLAASRGSLVETGTRFGLSQEAAETFADAVLNVPSTAVVNVSTPGSAEALREIGLLAQRISALTDKKISIAVATSLVNQERAQAARGGLMPARNAAGGYIAGPGTGTSDDILSWLSNGEYVIKASSVDKYGASFLDAVNAGRFAAGGPVGRRLEVATSTGDFGALVTGINALVAQGELAAARSMPPVFGGDERGAATPSGRGGLGPAAVRARQYVIDAFGVTNIGGYSNRNIAGTNKQSKHALGKAIDVMTGRNMALGQQVANAFHAQRGAFGVDNIIWNRRITNAGRGWQWGSYNGANPHTDHPHIDFYAQGGRVGSASNPHLRDAGGPLLPGCTFDPTTKETPA